MSKASTMQENGPRPNVEEDSAQLGKWVLGIFLLAMAVRVALVLVSGVQDMQDIANTMEPVRIAVSLLEDGTYADAYGDGIGRTAHCLPGHPLILAALLALFGQGTAGAFAIHLLGCAAASLGYALLPVMAIAWRLGRVSGVWAGLAGALLPINFWAQASGLFDQPLMFLGLTALSCAVGYCWSSRSFPLRRAAAVGGLGGLTATINAAVFPVLLAWGLLGLWRFPEQRAAFVRFWALAIAVVFLVLSPWALRNYAVFGKAIWTRSNFGLELYLSNNPQATADLEWNIRKGAFHKLHPLVSDEQRAQVQTMGEVAYHARQRELAIDWITDNPATFTRLTLQRIRNFWFPTMARWWQSLAQACITLGGIGGLIFLARHRVDSFWGLTGLLFGYSAIFLVIQVSPRYRFPIEPFLLLLACSWAVTAWRTSKADKNPVV